MRILHFDCFAGIAGDMAVGALRDLGVEEGVFRGAIAALGLPGVLHFHFERGSRQGISGWKFDMHAHEHSHAHEHAHDVPPDHTHPEHGRSYRDIRALLERSALPSAVARRAASVFARIAVAEGRIHGVPPDDVHFHEVGAVDSIADIVCACAGMEALAPDHVTASALMEGSGFVECAHGRFPLPAPATLAILEGIPLAQDASPGERITPTGAALLAEYASSFGPMPALRTSAIGYGLGTRDTPDRPNVLRAILGESDTPEETDEVVHIETNLDDTTPEIAGVAVERLLAAGARDAWTTPAHMKKNRPGFVLSALVPPPDAARFAELVLRETAAFGLRMTLTRRRTLARASTEVRTPHGSVRVKLGILDGRVLHASPELEDCRKLAADSDRPVLDIYRAACAAAETLRNRPPP